MKADVGFVLEGKCVSSAVPKFWWQVNVLVLQKYVDGPCRPKNRGPFGSPVDA